jgi:cellobiose phosphorylase
MRFGKFDDKKKEYVINRPDTPIPWMNYLGSQDYFGIISNTGGGYSFFRDARLRRITRYRYNNVPLDMGGRYLYIRDNESKDFWSPTWMPTQRPVEQYRCRHGLGYSVIGSRRNGIEAHTRYGVPLDDRLEIWELTVTNHRKSAARLSIFSAIEFCLWDAQDDATNFQRNFSTGEVEVDRNVIYHITEYRERRNHFAYFACSEKITGFDTQRESFLGPYRGWENPLVVERGRSADSVAHGWAPIGSHHIRLSLRPGETRTIIFLLGYGENPPDQKYDPPSSSSIRKTDVHPLIEKYSQPKNVETAFAELARYWETTLSAFQVETPDIHTSRMVNIWNAYQCMVTFNLSRSASQFESGIGRGMGFRDSNQDLFGIVHTVPDRARQRILDLASTQSKNGEVFHQYQPLTKQGNRDAGSGFNDDPLWLVLSVSAYIRETGDGSILDETVPFENDPEGKHSLWDHLVVSLEYTIRQLGPHSLPLIGHADWNDCLNLNCFSEEPGQSFQLAASRDGQTAESVFIGGLFVMAAKEFADLAERYRPGTTAPDWRAHAQRMEASVLAYGWDGEWFLRAYDDRGSVLGSQTCEEGKIFIEPQGICIMAGIGQKEGYARKALRAVQEHLSTEHGILLVQPSYSRYYLEYGEISSYPPGNKENGSVFCHTNPWIMIAEAKTGNGELAHDYYSRINPSARESRSELHRCEPYVYAQTITGRDAPAFGEAKNSWLTGAAAWNYAAITQYILGIRPGLYGLEISPVLPNSWNGFTARRMYRSTLYHITVQRIGTGNFAVVSVNGKRIVGSRVPLPAPNTDRVDVLVTLGTPLQ